MYAFNKVINTQVSINFILNLMDFWFIDSNFYTSYLWLLLKLCSQMTKNISVKSFVAIHIVALMKTLFTVQARVIIKGYWQKNGWKKGSFNLFSSQQHLFIGKQNDPKLQSFSYIIFSKKSLIWPTLFTKIFLFPI